MRVTPGPGGPLLAPSAPEADPHLPATDAGCEEVASRFRALSEPTRLKILRKLASGEASVGEILREVGGTQANVSKHLAILHGSSLVDRRKEGARTVYRVADPNVLEICSIVCAGVEREALATAGAILGVRNRPSEAWRRPA